MTPRAEDPGRTADWPLEPVALAAGDPTGLAESAAALESRLRDAPDTPLHRLDAPGPGADSGPWRLALLCCDAAELARELKRARSLLAADRATEIGRKRVFCMVPDPEAKPPSLAWLFPGLGSQHAGMLADLRPVFPVVNEWLETLDRVLPPQPEGPASRLLFPPDDLSPEEQAVSRRFMASLSGGALAGFAASLALGEVLSGLGCRPGAIAGHSIGENAALVAAGMVTGDKEVILRRALEFARVLEGGAVRTQAVAVSLADRAALERALDQHRDRVFWAMDNCPHQAVLIARPEDMAAILPSLQAAGAVCLPLDFSQPFHTPLFAERTGRIADLLAGSITRPAAVPVFSCFSGRPFSPEPEAARQEALAQWTGRVNFRLTLENLFAGGANCFLEVGPGKMISAFVGDTLRGRPHLALTTGSPDVSCLEQVLTAWCRLYVRGADLDPGLLRGRPSRSGAAEQAGGQTAQEAGLSRRARAILLTSHLDLTKQMLASQERLLGALLARGRAAAPAAPPAEPPAEPLAESWPLLGEAEPGSDGSRRWQRRLEPGRDLFLADHSFGAGVSDRQPDLKPLAVLPLAMGLEIMAQAGAALHQGRLGVSGLSAVRAHRWLAADPGWLDLAVQARPERGPKGEALVRVSLAGPEGETALEGTVHLAPAGAFPLPEAGAEGAPRQSAEAAGFYQKHLFHGPRYQGIMSLGDCSPSGLSARVIALAGPAVFAGTGPERFMLPVSALDCAGQMAAWWLRQIKGRENFGIYPFALESFQQNAPLWRGPVLLECRLTPRFEHGVLEASLEMRGEDGRVLARLAGYRLRYVQFSPAMQDLFVRPAGQAQPAKAWHEDPEGPVLRRVDAFDWDLLSSGQGIWQRMLAHLYLGRGERQTFYILPESGPRRAQWLLGRMAAKEAVRAWLKKNSDQISAPADIKIDSTDSGRPRAAWAGGGENEALPSLSISHCGAVAVAAADEPGAALGLDYENAAVSKPDSWLGEAFSPGETALANDGDPKELLALWCAKEATAKALGQGLQGGPTAFRVTAWDREAGLVRVKHQGRELTVRLWQEGSEVLALCRAGRDDTEANKEVADDIRGNSERAAGDNQGDNH